MCGRYLRRADKQRIAEHFRISESVFEIHPSYNVAPTSFQPVIRPNEETDERELILMRWGLIPSRARNTRALGLSTINAKAESLMEKPMWKIPFIKRRCLVVADGFYEWKPLDAKTKQPYAFSLKSDEPFAFAGVWERSQQPDGSSLESYAIITTEGNELTSTVHARMPVILKPEDYTRWLTVVEAAPPPIDLLRPFDADKMKAWRVSKDVGNVQNNHAELCLEWTGT